MDSREKARLPVSQVPRGGLQAMAAILVAMSLLAIYSNAQKARRDLIESVTILPAEERSTPSPAAPSPAAP